jgi:GT2 family glycosyltransferase
VVVIDNASDDGTVPFVRGDFPEVEVVSNDQNLGFAAATNLGIRSGSAPYVLVLNPDTEVPADGLLLLIRLMDGRAEVGICGCRLVRDDGTFDHAARRSFPTIIGAVGHFAVVGRSDRAPRRLVQYRAPDVEGGGLVDAVNGAFMLVRRSALDDVGLFDEGFWMYMEDLDLCYRFHEAGWATWYEPAVTALHAKGASSGAVRSPRLNAAFHYGMFRFYRKHYAPRSNALVDTAVYAGIAVKLVVSLVRNAVLSLRGVIR